MTSLDSDHNGDLITLAQWMAGEFTNARQAAENPQSFAHIHIFFRPLPMAFFDGVGFYSEQVYDYDLWAPYRQGVHRLVSQGDSIYIENYALIDPVLYAGAARELSILKTITPNCITRRWNCSMVFKRQGDRFFGQVEGDQCLIPKDGHSTFLVSEVVLADNSWDSLDQGFDVTSRERIWGSAHGVLKFEKLHDFSSEIN
jgi:CpeT protein